MKQLLVICMVLLMGYAQAQETPIAFIGGTIIPVSGPPIENGILLVQHGKIQAVGRAATVRLSSEVTRIDVSGKVLMPGLVDTHSHVGEAAGGDGSAALQPDVRVLDALNVWSPSLGRARAGGITTVNVMPGSGHLLSGQTAYLKLRKGNAIQELLLCKDLLNEVCGGMKMANGTNPMRDNGTFPGTRSRSAAMARQLFIKAQAYQRKIKEAAGDATKMPERDLQMEALVQVLEGKRTVHFHTHRADDILTAIRIGQEFGFKPVLQHVSEGWKVAKEIAASGFPASVIVIDSPGGKLEAMDMRFETGAALVKEGALMGYHTDDYITDSRLFLRSAALGMRAGLNREKALESVTLAGAKMLDLDHRLGTLESGKDADFIVLSGDPMSVYTRIEQTWIEGKKVFDLSNPEDRKYATGAYGVLVGDVVHTHHDGDEDGHR